MLVHVAARPSTYQVRRIRRDEYDLMIDAGLFGNERLELIRGTIVAVSPQKSAHAAVVERLTHVLIERLARRARVRVQLPFVAADDSVPEPDIAVVEPRDYDDAHPEKAFLVIEVADSSLAVDRGDRAALYAESAIPEYWIVNLVDDLVEVHTDVVRGAYSRVTPYRKGESIRPLAFPDVEIPVAAVLR
jgi:Uma2 family endonuclease